MFLSVWISNTFCSCAGSLLVLDSKPSSKEKQFQRQTESTTVIHASLGQHLEQFTQTSLPSSFVLVSWNHDAATPCRFRTNGIAERAVRRVTEEAASALVQYGLRRIVERCHGILLLFA